MIFRVSTIAGARAGVAARRFASTQVAKTSGNSSALNAFAATWYKLFGASTARYATFLAVGVIFAELATNKVTDVLWETNNSGRTYQQVDWSKFDPPDEDEEEEEEEEAGDDDDDDDDDE